MPGQNDIPALSRGQYQVANQAIKRNRRVMRVLAKLQAIKLGEILKKVSGVTKHNSAITANRREWTRMDADALK
jgi:hypothetical protein